MSKVLEKLHLRQSKDEATPDQSEPASNSTMASNLPKTYKACVIEAPNAPWALKDVELRMPGEGEVLIKVHACGVCHSDSAVQAGHFGESAKYPVVPGHEVIGTVVALGPHVKKWKEGDLVGGPWHGGHDGMCTACMRGDFQMCDNEAINGVTRDGGYAEYCNLRAEAAVRMPLGIDPASYAALLCAGVTVFNGIRQLNIRHGGTIAVQGLGGLGHLAVQYARKMGYRTVALSSSGAKRDFATQLGATDYVDGSSEDTAEALKKMGGADLILVTAPNPSIIGPLLKGCGPRGKLLVLAPIGDIQVDTVSMINYGLSVHGWPSGHAVDSEDAIAMAEEQGIKVMIEKFPLEKVADAVQHMLSGKVRFRAVLTMD